MQPPKKLLPFFDILLFGGLGCGVLTLCGVMAWLFFIVQNLPVPRVTTATPVELANLPTSTPLVSDSPTVAVSPTIVPTLDSTQPTLIPSAVPAVFPGTPPGGKIVFTCFIKRIDQICLMNADGTNLRQLTNFPATAFYASLSPDGQTIYFVCRKSGNFEIYSMDINGENLERLSSNIGSLYAPELSPAGDWILFTNNGNGLWLMRPNGKNPHPITFKDDIDPTWSPDGSMIAFGSTRSGSRQLYVMNANGSNVSQLTDLNNMGGRSTWSPDGTRLAFYRGPEGARDIYVINVDGSGLERLTNGGDNLGPSWSPDGNWIAFTSYRDGNNEIYIMHADGTGVTRLTDNPSSDWQPRWGR